MSDTTKTAFLSKPSLALIGSFFTISQFELDLETLVFRFDENFAPMLGLEPISSMSQEEFLVRFSQMTRNHFDLYLSAILNGHSSEFKQYLCISHLDGSLRTIECRARVEENNDNFSHNRKLIGLLRDSTSEKNALPELSESERWFREVLEQSPHAMYRIDYQSNSFDYVSKGFADALGVTREEILALPYTEFGNSIHPDDLLVVNGKMEALIKESNGGRITLKIDFRYKRKDGNYIWLDDTFTVIPGPDGQYAYQVGFGSVIEDRKYLELQLLKANEQLEEKVETRTTELRKANANLETMMHHRRDLEKKLLEISERERRFIGRELHDGLSQQIVGVQCMFEALRHRFETKKQAGSAEMKMMRDFLQDTVHQIRTLSRGLCPLALEPRAVGAALATLAAQTTVLYKVSCLFDGSTDLRLGDPDSALHLFRIAQEAVQNAIRHGHATNINIKMREENEQIHLNIENDGQSLPVMSGKAVMKPAHEAGSGLGLKLIDYRISMLGGTWKIANIADGTGVKLSIRAPMNGGSIQ
ncbi:MAG: PAS domain-containing protein [Candidatus Riflebacteria bacterium]|nr:PAS domain-containing protein [Candidatus Riflebacteria bacterium]